MTKTIRRTLSFLLALGLALGLVFSLSGCGSSDPPLEKTTAAPGETAPGSPARQPIPADKIIVGILHIGSVKDVSGYTYAHNKGFEEMKQALGLRDDQVVIRDNVDDSNVSATKIALQQLVDEGCDVIFATSYNYMQSVDEFAKEYPDVVFSHCSGYMSNETNFNNYFGRIYEARYLAGIAAGLKMKADGKPLAGYVAAMDSSNSEVTGGVNAWALGIQSVYPEAVVKVKVTGSWYDPEAEAAAAKALIDAGCYVIGQHCDTDGPQTTAQQNKVFGCGYNSDMTAAAPDAHLCAPIWNWGVYYTRAVQDVVNGSWAPVNYFGGMKEGLVGLSDLNEKSVAEGTAQAIEAARQKIIDGSLIVFDTGMKKADGTSFDYPLSDAEITGQINYYVKGVELL
ncbi:MAG: BMP family ABC transporter substrate-binding protein [Oscillospiraceae bacterium]|jgi:basic membrane protein A|nr:BMP family ABC transporter substrate-binding protein [Oscillospiraceae bacterium]